MKAHANYIFRVTILISLVCFNFQSNLFSQKLYRTGTILTSQNDSIKGYIKYEDWITSPVSINFKNEDGEVQTYSVHDIRGFSIESPRQRFESRKIGLLDFVANGNYREVVSQVVKDSVQVFLKVLVSGSHASLYLYLDEVEKPHYFLLANGSLKELYQYSLPKRVGGRNYLVAVDQYKEQLSELAKLSPGFNAPIPLFQEMYLRRYIKDFNKSFELNTDTFQSEREVPTLDFDLNVGLENWNEKPLIIDNKPNFGVGFRINFPGKMYKRFVKINFFVTPGLDIGYDSTHRKKIDLNSFEIAVGSYFGNRAVQPYVGF